MMPPNSGKTTKSQTNESFCFIDGISIWVVEMLIGEIVSKWGKMCYNPCETIVMKFKDFFEW